MHRIDNQKGQSAIEYLTTYGWMLLVIAIVGGAIFTTVQDSSQIQTTSGLANADVQIEDFGVTDNGLETELRAASADKVENVNVSLIDQETGETVYSDEKATIPIGGTETVSFTNVGKSENTNTYNVQITYDTGGLKDLTVNGTITGRIAINGSVDSSKTNPSNVNGLTANFTINKSTVNIGEVFKVNASNSTDSDGNIDAYEWDWTNDGVFDATGESQTHSYGSSGNKTIKLRVTAGDGSTDSTSKEIEVQEDPGTATVDAEVPSGTSLSLTFYEDTDNDGNPENSETVTAGDGTNSYSLTGFNWSTGNDIWVENSLSNSDITRTAALNYIDLSSVGNWSSGSEWNNAQSEKNVVHENVSNTDQNNSNSIKQGYSIANPYASSKLYNYWPLQEDNTSKAIDFAGNDNLSLGGSTQGVGGLLGTSAYSLDGSSNSLESSSVDYSSISEFTVNFWIYPRTISGTQGLFGHGDMNNNFDIRVRLKNGDTLNANVFDSNSNNNYINADGAVSNTNQWYMITLRQSGPEPMELFVDASSVGTAGTASGITQRGQDLSLGRRIVSGSDYFDGKISEVRFYDKRLNNTEINRLYNTVKGTGLLNTSRKSP